MASTDPTRPPTQRSSGPRASCVHEMERPFTRLASPTTAMSSGSRRMSMLGAPELAGVLAISARQTGHLPVSLRIASRQDAQYAIELPSRPQQGRRRRPSLSTRQMQQALVVSPKAGSTAASLLSPPASARGSMSAERTGRLLIIFTREPHTRPLPELVGPLHKSCVGPFSNMSQSSVRVYGFRHTY